MSERLERAYCELNLTGRIEVDALFVDADFRSCGFGAARVAAMGRAIEGCLDALRASVAGGETDMWLRAFLAVEEQGERGDRAES